VNNLKMNKTLFIDSVLIAIEKSNASPKGTLPDKWQTTNGLTDEDIAKTYLSWRNDPGSACVPPANAGETPALPGYENLAVDYKSATLKEIRKNDYVLTPERYVGAPPLRNDGIPFEIKRTEVSWTLYAQMEESVKLDEVIWKNMGVLGYGK